MFGVDREVLAKRIHQHHAALTLNAPAVSTLSRTHEGFSIHYPSRLRFVSLAHLTSGQIPLLNDFTFFISKPCAIVSFRS